MSEAGGDWIDSRFDAAYKKEFLGQFDNFYDISPPKDYPIPVSFRGDFDPKAQRAIQAVTTQCFEIAKAAGISVYHKGPEVVFFNPSSWHKAQGEKPIDLPAARMQDQEGKHIIQVVVPDEIKSTEVVIKTARLIAAKLFGSIFFHLTIPLRPPYRLFKEEITEIGFDPIDQAHLIRLLEQSSPGLDQVSKARAKDMMIHGPKGIEIGRKECFKEFLQKPSPEHPLFTPIQELFSKLVQHAQEEPLGFYHLLTDRIFSLIGQSNFILPHEKKGFHFQKEKEIWTIFHALEERLLLIANSIEELLNCYDYLTGHNSSSYDEEVLSSWKNELNLRMRQLKRQNLVKLYLFDDAQLGKNQQGDRARFPLWLWKKNLIQAKGPDPKKQIEHLTKQYQGSIYQKIFELAYRLNRILTQAIKKSDFKLSDRGDLGRLKTLTTGLTIRQDGILDLLHSARVGKSLQGIARAKKTNKSDVLTSFENGWSYFISFALIHQYYHQLDQKKRDKKERAEEFIKLIEEYISERIGFEEEYRISDLFLKLYRQMDYDLAQVIPLMQEPSETLDFFILHQKEIFTQKNKDKNEVIQSFSGKLEKWRKERYHQRVTEKEKSDYVRTFTQIG